MKLVSFPTFKSNGKQLADGGHMKKLPIWNV